MSRDTRSNIGKIALVAGAISAILLLPAAHHAMAGEETSNLPKEITSKDGSPMVLVPEGEFIMGTPKASRIRQNEQPPHTVYLDTFYIDKYEVTNALYLAWVEANGGGAVEPAYLPTNLNSLDRSAHAQMPVTSIMWKSAKGYCESVGKRLPTEAEWEKAARGTDGRKYPWGNEPPTDELAIFKVNPQNWKGPASFSPVDSHPKGASPYGAHHMAGNVFEWVNDIYEDEYYQKTPTRNPQGPVRGTMNKHGKKLNTYTVRGGSAKSQEMVLSAAFRAGWSHIYVAPHGGFRCAKSVGIAGATGSYAEEKE